MFQRNIKMQGTGLGSTLQNKKYRKQFLPKIKDEKRLTKS